jgi:phosphatidate cytidylyltransferase
VNEKNKNLVVRIVSALVLLPVVLFLLWKGGAYSAALFAVAAAACASEYYTITLKQLSPAAWVGLVLAGVVPLLPLRGPEHPGELAFWLTAGMFFFAWTYHLIRGPLPEAPARAAHLLTGFLYGAVGLMALSALRMRESDGLA